MPDRRDEPRLRRFRTEELGPDRQAAIRALLDAAFGTDENERFTDEDWRHSIGGTHFVLEAGRMIVAHGSVVERDIHVAGAPLRTGYVEAVATATDRQGEGLGSLLMTAVSDWIREGFELGALGTGRHRFYERLGWVTWRGPSSVRTTHGEVPTPDDDGHILVLRTPRSPVIDLDAAISCEWRPGDVW